MSDPAGHTAVWGEIGTPAAGLAGAPWHKSTFPPLTEGHPLGTRSFWARWRALPL